MSDELLPCSTTNEFYCTICIEVCKDAVAPNCCHQLFCQGCLTQWIEQENKCPYCRHDPVRFYKSIIIRRIIGNWKVSCEKCRILVPRADLTRHGEDFCEKRQVRCDFCQSKVVWDELAAHKGPCSKRFVKCTDCQENVKKENMDDHLSHRCKRRQISCQSCKCSIPYDTLKFHADFLCGYETSSESTDSDSWYSGHATVWLEADSDQEDLLSWGGESPSLLAFIAFLVLF